MPPIAHPTYEDRQWRRRRRKGGSRTGGPLHGLRLRDLETIFRHRYGGTLPDDDAGREDAVLVLHHMVGVAVDPRGRMRRWLSTWCPWLETAAAEQMVERAIAKPRRYRADTLAAKINLQSHERAAWRITTIGAVDLRRDARLAARKEKKRQAEMTRRRARGAQSRAKFLASSLSNTKPWLAEGISRRTWYRRQHAGTGPWTAHPHHMPGTQLCHSRGRLSRANETSATLRGGRGVPQYRH